jgi:hypothetical protein
MHEYDKEPSDYEIYHFDELFLFFFSQMLFDEIFERVCFELFFSENYTFKKFPNSEGKISQLEFFVNNNFDQYFT